jgi:hypothetical protein
MKRGIVLFLVGLFVFGCGSNTNTVNQSASEKLNLYLFAAENCAPCREELSQLGPKLHSALGDKYSQVNISVVVTNGKDSGTHPTADIADNFKNMIGFEFTAIADPWNRKTYRRFFGQDSTGSIPAAVVTDAADQNPVLFQPATFVPDQIVNYLAGHL